MNSRLLFLVCQIALANTQSDTKYTRLERRIYIIEQKLFHDSNEFREDIAAIIAKLNDTTCTANNANIEELCSRTTEQTDQQQESQISDANEITEAELAVIRLGIKDEKQYIRASLSELEGNYFATLNGLTDKLQSIQGEIAAKMSTEILHIQSECATNTDKLRQTVERNMSFLEETVKTQNEQIKQLESSQAMILTNMVRLKRRKESDCGSWTKHNKSCYLLSSDTLTWSEANTKCESMDAYLTEVASSEKQTFLANLTRQSGKSGNGPWLGGSDLEKDGVWVWKNSGRLIDNLFSAWNRGEPNGRTKENCLHFRHYDNSFWNDAGCQASLAYICERDAE